jgi:DNA polymerase-3 subunit gamma/tau
MFRVLVKEQEDLAWAPEPLAVLEMALVRIATLAPGDDVARLLARLDALERRLAGAPGDPADPAGGAPPSGPGEPATPGRRTRPPGARSAAPAPARAPAGPGETAEAARFGLEPEPAGAVPAEPPSEPGLPDLGPPLAGLEAPLAVVFDRLRAVAREENRGLYAVLDEGRLLERSGDRLRIALPAGFAARRLAARLDGLEAVCARIFGRRLRIELETVEAADGPAGRRPSGPPPDSDLARRRRQDALGHPGVNDALDVLGGEILEIRPLGGGAPAGARGDGGGS